MSDEDSRISDFAKKHSFIMAKSVKVNDKTTVYLLAQEELSTKDKSDIEKDFTRCFDPARFSLLFIRDLHPTQLKRVLEEYKTVYVENQELCDAILASLLTLSHDFRHFVNEKMNMTMKKRLKEILAGFHSE